MWIFISIMAVWPKYGKRLPYISALPKTLPIIRNRNDLLITSGQSHCFPEAITLLKPFSLFELFHLLKIVPDFLIPFSLLAASFFFVLSGGKVF
jgi:hypothetical protein